jgi:DNA-binding XRE family transcriptional regulator
MKIKEVIRLAMKETKTTQQQLADRIGARHQSVISERLKMDNLSINTALEMLEALGYEMVIQEKRRGRKREGQITIERSDIA